MPRHRTQPNHPFIQSLLDRNGVTEVNALLDIYPGLEKSSLYRYANLGAEDKTGFRNLQSLRRNARALGMTLDELVDKLLGDEQSQQAC